MRIELYECRGLPNHWVAEDVDGGLWIIPAIAEGWKSKTPFRGHRSALVPAPEYCRLGLGLPVITD